MILFAGKKKKRDDTDDVILPGYVFKMKNRKKEAKTKPGGNILGFKEKFAGHIIPLDSDCKSIFLVQCRFKIITNGRRLII